MSDSWARRLARRILPRGVKNALRHPAAALRAVWRDASYSLAYVPQCAVTADWTVRCHPRTLEAFHDQAEIPEHRDELNGFIARCRSGMILLDIGSHYGMFTLAALRFGGPEARVWAVDPSPTCIRLLTENVRLAGPQDRVTIVQAAVGAEDGMLNMLSTGAHGCDFFVASETPRIDATQVPQYRLDTFAASIPKTITHLKIDVEGHEDAVVAGGREFLKRSRPLLFLELHGDMLRGAGKDPAAVLSDVAACGYDRFEARGRPVTIPDIAREPIARLICLPEGMT